MSYIEIIGDSEEFSRQQRWSHLLTLVAAASLLLFGLNTRAGALGATTTYADVQAGVVAQYPQRWLIDFDGDYVFQVRDITRVGFNTTILIAIEPVGDNATERNVLDALNIQRPQFLLGYDPLSIEPVVLPDDSDAVALEYTFVDSAANPFLESVATVVRGRDVITLKGGQAIIITFRADAQTFDTDITIFDRFLNTLEF